MIGKMTTNELRFIFLLQIIQKQILFRIENGCVLPLSIDRCHVNWAHDLPIGARKRCKQKNQILFASIQIDTIRQCQSKQQTRLLEAKATRDGRETNQLQESHAFGFLRTSYTWILMEILRDDLFTAGAHTMRSINQQKLTRLNK